MKNRKRRKGDRKYGGRNERERRERIEGKRRTEKMERGGEEKRKRNEKG